MLNNEMNKYPIGVFSLKYGTLEVEEVDDTAIYSKICYNKYIFKKCKMCDNTKWILLYIRRRINHVKRFFSHIQHKISVKRCNHQRKEIKWHRHVHCIKSPISPFLDCFICSYITGDHSISFTWKKFKISFKIPQKPSFSFFGLLRSRIVNQNWLCSSKICFRLQISMLYATALKNNTFTMQNANVFS